VCKGAVGPTWAAPFECQVSAHTGLVFCIVRVSRLLQFAATVMLDEFHKSSDHNSYCLQSVTTLTPRWWAGFYQNRALTSQKIKWTNSHNYSHLAATALQIERERERYEADITTKFYLQGPSYGPLTFLTSGNLTNNVLVCTLKN